MTASRLTGVVLLLLVAGGGWKLWTVWSARQRSYSLTIRDSAQQLDAARMEAKQAQERLNERQVLLDRCQSAGTGDLQNWFSAFGKLMTARPFLARLKIAWTANFFLTEELDKDEHLLGGRKPQETYGVEAETLSSAGFLLGRRSNALFGLIMVRLNDSALNDPGEQFRIPPGAAEVETPPGHFNRRAKYALGKVDVRVDVVGEVGCGAGTGPASIVHAWRTQRFLALVVGCETELGGVDLPLFSYEGYSRWGRWTNTDGVLPTMTPDGSVAMSTIHFDGMIGDTGWQRNNLGMPGSVSTTFLPYEEAADEPVLHSVVFQLDAATQEWFPFWSVRKQLSSATEVFNFQATSGLAVPLRLSPAVDPALRARMLPSFQALMNFNREYVSATDRSLS